MALTPKQREDLINKLDQLDSVEVDNILSSMHNFVDWLYYNVRAIYNAVKNALQSVWDWIKSIFS